MVTDYKKLFEKDGYYDRYRRRYDLILSEPKKVQEFIGVDEDIKVHLIFLSSKSIELEEIMTELLHFFLLEYLINI